MSTLSVVIATLNRLPYLKKCIASCAGANEIIVVDGGSTDGTPEWVRTQPVILIEQGGRYGAVYAFNEGFSAAECDYVAALNDDCTVVGDTLKKAVAYLDTHENCGQVAIPWRDTTDPSRAHVMPVPFGKQGLRVIYANFGVTRRWLGDKVGWWGKDAWLVHYSGDCELSFMVMMEGYTVDELVGGEITHYRVQDETRLVCYSNPEWKNKWMNMDVSHLKQLSHLMPGAQKRRR